MIKINLKHGIQRSVSRPTEPAGPHIPSIGISRRSAEAMAQNRIFGLNSPLLCFAAPVSPSKDLIELKNDILDALREKERYAEEDLQVLEQSFDFMIRFHGKETLPSGERIAIRLLGVARTLAEWGCDPLIVSAGLLHLASPENLQKENIDQRTIHFLQKKKALERSLFEPLKNKELTKEEAEDLTKMCLMQEGDRKIWLLEAADEFVILSSISETDELSKFLASRAYRVTSPILSLFDLDDIAVKVEDIALLRLDKEEYQKIETKITDANKRDRFKTLEHLRTLTGLISEELNKAGIEHRHNPDVKSVARAKKKLDRGEELTDASRFRIIIKGTRKQCKQSMFVIKKVMGDLGYTEFESERKNYIAGITAGEEYDLGPKPNRYESLHLHFRGERFEPLNVQIRTEEMHVIAELGSASHGRFKLNGMIKNLVIDEASVTRQRLVESGQRFGRYGSNLYGLVPYPSSEKIKLIDLLFAISPEHGLRAPAEVSVERIDPETGEAARMKLPISAPLENGDRILFFKKLRKVSPTRIRANLLSTLPALIAHRLAREGGLDPAILKERSSSAATKGKTALGFEISAWRSQLRERLTSLLKKEGENIEALKLETLFSLEHAAKGIGVQNEEGMHLAVGLARQREKLIERVMNIIKSSSTAAAYKILTDPSYVDLWLMVSDVPGAFFSTLNLFKGRGFSLIRLSNQHLSRGTSLIKARVKSRKKTIEEDVLPFFSEAKDLYESTRPPLEGIKQTKINIHLRLPRLDINKISRITEVLQKGGANIVSANFPPVLERRSLCSLLIEIPANSFERFKNRLDEEFKNLEIKGHKIYKITKR